MNVQPKLWNHCPPMMHARPEVRLAGAVSRETAPVTVLGIADGRVLALGEVP